VAIRQRTGTKRLRVGILLAGTMLAAAVPCALLAQTSGPEGREATFDKEMFLEPIEDLPGLGDPDGEIITGAVPAPASPRLAPTAPAREPRYRSPPGSGAGETGSGFDSLNRKKKQPAKPGEQKHPVSLGAPAAQARPPVARPQRVRPPVSAAFAGTAAGQPLRRRLPGPEPDAFGPVGVYAGSFLTKSAVELRGGYDTNPGRFVTPRGSAFYTVAPELLIASDWSRHSLIADLRGAFTGYGSTFPLSSGVPGPENLDRPEFFGVLRGRIDVNRDNRIIGELRSRIATDNPGSPNLQVGLVQYPLAFSNGITVGYEQDIGRLRWSAAGTADRTTYQSSLLTDGTRASNADRAYSQYGGVGRVGYDLSPGLQPFVEVEGDTRVHDAATDRNGYLRNSSGGYIKVGSTFELSRLLTGEAAVGYVRRSYDDPRLRDISAFLTSASLVWVPSALTTVRLIATSSVDETTLPGVSGVMSRTYVAQVDHDFRRWLTGTVRFAFGTADYDGAVRSDKNYSAGIDVTYKLSRTVHIKGSIRHDWLRSNLPNVDSEATIVMLGVRLQR